MSDDDWDIDEPSKPSASTPVAPVIAPKPAARSKWQDEDQDDEQDDWDKSDDEKPKASAAVAPGPVRKKKLKEKLAEKERLAREGGGDDNDLIDTRTAQERAREARMREMEADLETAADLMGGAGVQDAGELLQAIVTAKPKSKADFETLSKNLMAGLISPHASNPLFPAFAEQLAKDLCESLTAVQVRKVSSGLSTLGNTKQQEERDRASGKKKAATKPKLGAAKPAAKIDTEAYDDVLEDDDFM